MAKTRSLDDAMNKYGNSGDGFEWFKLANDKDTETVRILHEGDRLEPEEDWFIVHKIQIENKDRYVQCTEEGDCSCCVGGNAPQLKLFLQLVTKSDGKPKLWERGKTFVPKITGLINKYGSLCNRPYDIERHGKAKDTNTTYEFYALDRDDKTLENIPIKRQKLLGKFGEGFIIQASNSEMEQMMKGTFKGASSNSSSSSDRSNDRGNERSNDRGNDREENRRRERRDNTDLF